MKSANAKANEPTFVWNVAQLVMQNGEGEYSGVKQEETASDSPVLTPGCCLLSAHARKQNKGGKLGVNFYWRQLDRE